MGEPNQYSRDIKRTAAQRDGILHRRFHWCIHAVQYLARKPLSALLTMIAIGIAVTLPIEALRVSQSMSVIARSVDAADLSIYLSPTLSDTELNTHLTTLRTRPDIDIIRIISPAEGVAELACLLYTSPSPRD